MGHAAGNVSINQSIYLSRGNICPFQCSREVGNALFSTCAHYNWRLVSNKIPGILAMMQMTQGRQQQRSETPEKQQILQDKTATRKRRREAESPDQRESGGLERQKEYQRVYRRRRRKAVAATEQTVNLVRLMSSCVIAVEPAVSEETEEPSHLHIITSSHLPVYCSHDA